MKRIYKYLPSGLLALLICVSCLGSASADTFNQNNVIDDGIFDSQTMGASQIDTFLNGFSSSCISPNSGFKAIDPTGYNPSSGYLYGGYVTAGQVIYDAAQAYGINPQVLLSTLEKEQSLVTGRGNYSGYCNNGDQHKYAAAVGYGCPDSGTTYSYSGLSLYQRNGTVISDTGTTCVNSSLKAGFSQQVIRGAWLLKFGEQRAEGNVGWAVIKGNWDNSDDPQSCYGGPMTQGTWQRCPSGGSSYYDGYTTIDGTAVHMDTGATAALYWYTPHFSGNQSFFTIFSGWFGNTHNPYFGATYDSESPYPILDSGTSQTVYFRFKNTGNSFWKDDLSTFPGYFPVHIATTYPINRTSAFQASNWINNARSTGTLAAVYDANGTLNAGATSQHTVQPGQIGEFQFTIYANPKIPGGVYREYFQPIIEGASGYGWNMGGGVYLDIGVNVPSYKASYYSESAYPTITRGSSAPAVLKFKNTGASPWYDDTSIWPGKQPVHLATSWPINRTSVFNSGWPATTRPDVNFTKVYNSDGSTLASSQHVVQPGQIAEFDFNLSAPANATPGFYQEHFEPIAEGAPGYSWSMDTDAWLGVTVN